MNPFDAIGELLKDLGAVRNISGPPTKAPCWWKRFTATPQSRMVMLDFYPDRISCEIDDNYGTRTRSFIYYTDPDLLDTLEHLFTHGCYEDRL